MFLNLVYLYIDTNSTLQYNVSIVVFLSVCRQSIETLRYMMNVYERRYYET